MPYGECGRYPIYTEKHEHALRYWIRLVNMPQSRYPKTSHNMMCTNDKNGKINWFTNVRNLLESCGFEYAFLLDCISFPNAFIKSITQR